MKPDTFILARGSSLQAVSLHQHLCQVCQVVGSGEIRVCLLHGGYQLFGCAALRQQSFHRAQVLNLKVHGLCISSPSVPADKEDGTYYVYIDALTGAEADVFKVVETSEGTMLM